MACGMINGALWRVHCELNFPFKTNGFYMSDLLQSSTASTPTLSRCYATKHPGYTLVLYWFWMCTRAKRMIHTHTKIIMMMACI